MQQRYQTLPIAGTRNAMVVGMSWQTVLGQDLTAAAMKAAHKDGATYFTQAGPRSPAVGTLVARGRDRRAKARTRLYSAAAAFGQLYRYGTQIAYAELPGGSFWVAVAVDGTVQAGCDRIFPDAGAAAKALDGFLARYRDATVHGGGSSRALPFQLSQLDPLANAQSALRRASFRISMVSPIWWFVLVLGLTYFIWDTAHTWWREQKELERQRVTEIRDTVDGRALWTKALENWANTTRVDGEAGLHYALDSLSRIPLTPGRWMLQEASCLPRAGICTAKYARSSLADNNTLIAALPGEWKISFLGLNNASASWPLHSLPSKALTLDVIPKATSLDRTWIPAWQGLSPALQDLKLDAAKVVPVQVPNIRLPNGLEQPINLPTDMVVPTMRTLIINAPLRSLYALALPEAMSITQLQVRHQPDAQAKLAASRLVATFEGTIYVKPR